MNEDQSLSLAVSRFLDGLAQLIAEHVHEKLDRDQAKVQKDSGKPARLLTPNEVARLLVVPRRRVYELVARKKISAVRIGRLIRIPEAGLQSWLSEGGD